jgi:hypothetical protein
MACSVKTLKGDPPSLFVYFFFALLALGLHIGVFVLTDWLSEQKSSFRQGRKEKGTTRDIWQSNHHLLHTRFFSCKAPKESTASPHVHLHGSFLGLLFLDSCLC